MRLLKSAAIFSFGGLAYGLAEIIWRDETHISMFFVGGLCYLIISAIDSLPIFGGCLLFEAPLFALAITAVEFTSGVVINLWLGLGVWDYSELPLNLLGQICLPFSAIWLWLSVPAAMSARLLKNYLFGEPLPPLRFIPRKKYTAEV